MTPLKSLLLSLCLLTLLAACGGDDPTETLPPVTPPDEEEPIIPPGDDEDNANANEADTKTMPTLTRPTKLTLLPPTSPSPILMQKISTWNTLCLSANRKY